MAESKIPPVPKGTGSSGRSLWRSVLGDYELDEHELALLREAVRLVDRLDRLHEAIEADGELVQGLHGPRAHPALVEARQQQITLARLMAALRMPDGEEESNTKVPSRRQRRAGVRGVYSMRSA